MEKKKRKKRIRLIKSLVLVCAFVIAIGATFGMTMAYFGGSSNAQTGTMTLKTGVWVNSSDISSAFTKYVVPSEIVSTNAIINVKSSKLATDNAVTTNGTDALLRAKLTFAPAKDSTITIPDDNKLKTSYAVTVSGGGTGGNTSAYLVLNSTDGFYYLMNDDSQTALTDDSAATMYVIKSSTGEVSLNYTLQVQVPSGLGNLAGGEKITISVSYDVIQADYYSTSTTADAKTIKKAKEIFTAVEKQTGDNNANYDKPAQN